ncbi:MAG TPA: metalloregulator ArsR/SmtB family transcription factor [Actinomycetota bacterium]|nr:metalloregulator ArsR/SmtB family transcription factor [Actinomycetota bacterium]
MQDVLEAISHPARREMLRAALAREVPAGEMAAVTGLKQPAASQHLRILREAGLVHVGVDGQRRLYRANRDRLAQLRAELEAFWAPALEDLRRVSEEEAGS